MHYLDVRKKRSQNEFEEDIDRELEWNQREDFTWRIEIQWKNKEEKTDNKIHIRRKTRNKDEEREERRK